MRGQPQAAGARLLAVLPGRRWSSWSSPIEQKPPVTAEERIETIARLQAEERAARRSGRYVAEAAYLGRRW
ncbi:MAG TPA: hypothetical protein VLW51_04740 [Solirubrobacteraceae bacterium]|jgi:hypothetical protein|nr:hypothetical protein [Solirubrobacteraceae bacterium]